MNTTQQPHQHISGSLQHDQGDIPNTPLIARAGDACQAHFGGKAGALARLDSLGLPIPPWFVVTPEAFTASLAPAQHAALLSARTAETHRSIGDVEPAPWVAESIAQALNTLCPHGEYVAVRSSAIDEDGNNFSFAGQLESFLSVAPDEVPRKVAAVWRSSWGDRVRAYHRTNQLPAVLHAPAVLIQRMVQADSSGVAFGANPVTGQRGIAVVAAVRGLGTALVSGECDADTWHVGRDGTIVERTIADKRIMHRADPNAEEGIRRETVTDEQALQPALGDKQIQAIASLVRQVSRHAGCPQDIEWAIEGDQLFLLQSRPITTLATQADPDGGMRLWDNSNIAESYGGITTPLTFSFAHHAYQEVYQQFCRLMGVPEQTIADHAATFASMIGLVRGRVYYNLLSWYQALALLPGFASNRAFMEQMMGVGEGLPQEVVDTLNHATPSERWRDRLRLVRAVAGLFANYLLLDRTIQAFYARLNDALDTPHPQLEDMRPDELVAHYRDLERRLLRRWDAPLVNDFFCMIFFGMLRKMTADQDGTLYNDLLRNQGGIISAEPARRLAELGNLAMANPAFVETLVHGPLDQILRDMEQIDWFQERYQEYVARFGDRCLDELKLESATLVDDPLVFLRSVGQFARRLQREAEPQPKRENLPNDQLAAHSINGHLFKRLLFRWVLKNTRERVRERENLRFERTRLFGRARRIFVELGRRFAALHLLDDYRDMFFLDVDEVLGFVEGTTTTTNLKGLVGLRQAEFAEYRKQPAPDSRFQTYGIVNHGNRFRGAMTQQSVSGETLQGIGCCSGRVRGPVRIVTDPTQARIQPGEILVAERTDPGWIMLFPCAAAVLVERGSLLSHAAIVARELGIPTIVSAAGATQWLQNGDWVELDGGSGLVRRIEAEKA